MKTKLKKLEIKNGYIQYPEDWVILNPNKAKDCSSACVVECKNNPDIPHYLFFTNKTRDEYNKAFYDEVNELCCMRNTLFEKVLNTNELNVGYFPIYSKDEAIDEYSFPYDAMVVLN